MRIGRTLPPAAAPIYLKDIFCAIKSLLHSRRELERFKSEIKNCFHVPDCFLFSSGKAALALALLALKQLTPGKDEVIVPAYVCYSVPSAVVRAGLKVVPCDLKPNSLEMNQDILPSLLSQATLCVIVPHLFGLPAAVSEIRKLCREKRILVLEDAAQTIGIKYNGKMLGTQGDIGFFSLGRGKSFSTVEGGILITNETPIARLFQQKLSEIDSYTFVEKVVLLIKAILIWIFSRPSLYWLPKALPFLKLGDTIYDPDFPLKKMSSIQAGLARNWMEKVQGFNAKRVQNALLYKERIQARASVSFFPTDNEMPVCLRLPLFAGKLEEKAKIVYESQKKGLGVMFTYPDSIDGIPQLGNILAPGAYPEAKRLSQHILTLPVHPFMTKQDIDKVVNLFEVCGTKNVPWKTD